MSKGDAYSPFKVFHHTEKMSRLKQSPHEPCITPVFAQIDISNKCNLNCAWCFYRIFLLTDWNENAMLSRDDVIRLLDELREIGVRAIEWTGGGSVETHPDYKEFFKYAKKLGFQQAFVTNGTLLDSESLELIKDFEWVRFSIDASTRETFFKAKGVDLFDKAIENMKKLIEIKSRNNIIGFSFIVHPINYKEIYSAGLLAKKIGCDNIRYSLAMTPKGDKLFNSIWSECVTEMNRVKDLEDENFKVFEFSNRIRELKKDVLSEYCGYHHFVAVIAPNGVYPCCRLKDYAEYNFGRIQEQSFKKIWFGEKRKAFIQSIRTGCPFDCWMTQKNKFIKYMLEDSPIHVNFV